MLAVVVVVVVFFFSLFNVKNNFDTQLEYVDLRDSVKILGKKREFGMKQHQLYFRFR